MKNQSSEENNKLREKTDCLKAKLDNLESYTRRNCIVIQGIPIQTYENPIEVAVKVCEMVGVKLDWKKLDVAHRLPKSRKLPETNPPPFIMKLLSRFKKEEIVVTQRNSSQRRINWEETRRHVSRTI